jgi:hypothetical protein
MVFISLTIHSMSQLGHNASFQILSNSLFSNHATNGWYTVNMGKEQSLNKIQISVHFMLQHSVTTL